MTMIDPGSEYGESVRTAVANEVRRRRRTFAIYLSLIALPIIIAGYAIARAPQQADVLATKVTPAVVAQSRGEIQQQVRAAVTTHAAPIIQESVHERVTAEVREAVAPVTASTERLETQYVELDAQVTTLSNNVRSDAQAMQMVQPRLAEIDALEARIEQVDGVAREALASFAPLRAAQQDLRARLAQNSEQDDQTAAALNRLTQRVDEMDKQIAALRREVQAMRENTRWRIYHRPAPKTQ